MQERPSYSRPPSGRAVAVGNGLKVKVNANIGTSPDLVDEDLELLKLDAAVKAGSDAVMDLSTGGDLRSIRKRLSTNPPFLWVQFLFTRQ